GLHGIPRISPGPARDAQCNRSTHELRDRGRLALANRASVLRETGLGVYKTQTQACLAGSSGRRFAEKLSTCRAFLLAGDKFWTSKRSMTAWAFRDRSNPRTFKPSNRRVLFRSSTTVPMAKRRTSLRAPLSARRRVRQVLVIMKFRWAARA